MAYASLSGSGDGAGISSYGRSDDGLAGIFDFIGKAITGIPIIGPAIGATIEEAKARLTGKVVQQVAAQPVVQQAVYQSASQQGTDFLARYQMPILVGGAGLLAVLLATRGRRGRR